MKTPEKTFNRLRLNVLIPAVLFFAASGLLQFTIARGRFSGVYLLPALMSVVTFAIGLFLLISVFLLPKKKIVKELESLERHLADVGDKTGQLSAPVFNPDVSTFGKPQPVHAPQIVVALAAPTLAVFIANHAKGFDDAMMLGAFMFPFVLNILFGRRLKSYEVRNGVLYCHHRFPPRTESWDLSRARGYERYKPSKGPERLILYDQNRERVLVIQDSAHDLSALWKWAEENLMRVESGVVG